MGNHRRRRTALATTVLLLGVIAATNVVLRHDIDRSRAERSETLDELAERQHEIRALRSAEGTLRQEQAVADATLREATARLDALLAAEAEAVTELHLRTDERLAAQAQLEAAMADVAAASGRSHDNAALLDSLDRCLDGATRAVNAMAVGDERRALAEAEWVRDACAGVDAVTGR